MAVGTAPGVRLRHGAVRLLELEHQRVISVAADEEDDEATDADAAHADDLARDVVDAEPVEQQASLRRRLAR